MKTEYEYNMNWCMYMDYGLCIMYNTFWLAHSQFALILLTLFHLSFYCTWTIWHFLFSFSSIGSFKDNDCVQNEKYIINLLQSQLTFVRNLHILLILVLDSYPSHSTVHPVKNMTWNTESHGNSMSFLPSQLDLVWWWFGPNWHQIPRLFHVI